MRKAGINVQKFEVATTAAEAGKIARELGAKENVIKVCMCSCMHVCAFVLRVLSVRV